MFHVVYVLWGLLPFVLFLMTLRAWFRIVMKRPGREYPLRYLKQAIYTSVVLALAIFTDQWFVDDLLDFVGGGMLHNDIIRFAWYPALLTVLGILQKPIDGKEKRVFSDDLRARMRLPAR